MVISKEKYCVVSKSFPMKFYVDGYGYDDIEKADFLMSKEDCEKEIEEYDEPEEFKALKVVVSYEF